MTTTSTPLGAFLDFMSRPGLKTTAQRRISVFISICNTQ